MKFIDITSVLLLAQLVSCYEVELGNCRLDCDKPYPIPDQTSIPTNLPTSCDDFNPNYDQERANGVFTIYPYGNQRGLRVYCDFKTDGGNWLVVQRRIDGSQNFFRFFQDYVNGFGRLKREFWLGLEALHALTSEGEYELRFDMEDFENQTRYAVYSDFSVGPGDGYALQFGEYNGTAGDSLRYHGEGVYFSARDRDQDNKPSEHCARSYKGGFWYNECHRINPNGLYLGGQHSSYADGIEWFQFRGHHYSLKRMEMKMRKIR